MKVFAVLLLWAGAALAQYPDKPVKLLLTFSGGGQADLLARLVSDRMKDSLGQPIVVEPRPGAGGNIAMEATAKAPADGYTLVFGTPAVAINGALYRKLSYDPVRDLAPLSLAALGNYVLYASGKLPASSVAELIAYAKANPGKVNYASVGVGSGTHLAGVLFALAADMPMTHVPYKGIQQIAPDLVSGEVQLTFNASGPLQQFVESGRVKMLGTTGPRRMKQLPGVPAVAETLPGFEAAGWYGFFTTAGTPPAVLQKLNTAIVKAVSSPDIFARIESMALVPAPQSLDEASRFVAAEAAKWSRAVKASGATVD